MSFNLSKLIQTFIEPANALALLLLLGALFLSSSWENAQSKARRLIQLLAILLIFMMLFPVGEWALRPLEDRYARIPLPEKADGIILLTGDENPGRSEARGQPTGGAASSRYIRLAALARQYPKARIIVSGNTAPNYKSKVTTQTVARQIMTATGIDMQRVTFEEDSLTTYENARLTARKLRGAKDETWLLLTSAAHMPRAVLCFEKQNVNVIPAPTDFQTSGHAHWGLHPDLTKQLAQLHTATHEYYGLLGYWLSGRIERLWK